MHFNGKIVYEKLDVLLEEDSSERHRSAIGKGRGGIANNVHGTDIPRASFSRLCKFLPLDYHYDCVAPACPLKWKKKTHN